MYSYLELWQPFCSVERNDLCNFGRRYYEEQFSEIIFNLDQWFSRRCRLKYFYLELWRPSCSVEWNHLCNFERGHHGEHSCYMKFEIVVQKEMSFKEKVYRRTDE